MRQQGVESDGSARQGPEGSEGVTLAPHRRSPRAGAGRVRQVALPTWVQIP